LQLSPNDRSVGVIAANALGGAHFGARRSYPAGQGGFRRGHTQIFLKAWHDAVFMKRRPGFISTQLHRAVGESPTYLNYAVWESTAHFRQAFTNPEFQSKLAGYPPSAVASPHLFRKIAVPDICVA